MARELERHDLVEILDQSWKSEYPAYAEKIRFGIVNSMAIRSALDIGEPGLDLVVSFINPMGRKIGQARKFSQKKLKFIAKKGDYINEDSGSYFTGNRIMHPVMEKSK